MPDTPAPLGREEEELFVASEGPEIDRWDRAALLVLPRILRSPDEAERANILACALRASFLAGRAGKWSKDVPAEEGAYMVRAPNSRRADGRNVFPVETWLRPFGPDSKTPVLCAYDDEDGDRRLYVISEIAWLRDAEWLPLAPYLGGEDV